MEDNKKHSKLSLLNKIWVQTNKTFYKQSKKKTKTKICESHLKHAGVYVLWLMDRKI